MSRAQITALVTGTFLVTAFAGIGLFFTVGSGDQDRPPIIVRGGSIYLDGGTPTDWKPWQEHGNKKTWQPDQSHGASTKNFAVTVSNSNGPAAPTSPCPALPIIGTTVTIEYTTNAGVKSNLRIGRADSGSKKVPQVDAPADLTRTPGSGSTPDRITYDPGAGYISNVTIVDDSGNQQMCGFLSNARALITIQPTR
jgi:hypothetical protein